MIRANKIPYLLLVLIEKIEPFELVSEVTIQLYLLEETVLMLIQQTKRHKWLVLLL